MASSYGSGSVLNAGEATKEGLKDWITSGSKRINDRLYGAIDNLVNPNLTRPLRATERVAGDIAARRAASGLDGAGKAVDLVFGALPAQRPQGLTYQGLKDLRSTLAAS